MVSPLFINECRISLSEIEKLKALKYSSRKLSSKHKKDIERRIHDQLKRVAIFEGEILFCLIDQQAETASEKELLKQFLEQEVRNFNDHSLQPVTLLQLPTSTIERLVFALVAGQARASGIFNLRGRTFFEPSGGDRKVHRALDTTLVTEDGWVKLYFVPTYVALTEIASSKRSETINVRAIALCSFRNECSVANTDGSCVFVSPGYRGFVAEDKLMLALSEHAKEGFIRGFESCPQIGGVERIIEVKPTKGARNTYRYPSYAVQLHFAEEDFVGRQKAQFRESTLMSSMDRWQRTQQWLGRIFGNNDEVNSATRQTILEHGGVRLPVTMLLDLEHVAGRNQNSHYKLIRFADLKIVVDRQNPRPMTYGGGYAFVRFGAYDRQDPNRPFDTIAPFVILPSSSDVVNQTRLLMRDLDDGYEAKSNVFYDKPFEGLNQSEGRQKYNVNFVDPWEEEEFVLLNDTADRSYLAAVDDFVRKWNASDERDSSRLVIVVKPPETSTSNSPSLYYNLKSKLDGAGIPNQFITFDTLADLTLPRVGFGPTLRSLWLNMYAKMGGIPWRLENEIGNVHCFIGIGFGVNTKLPGEHIYAGVAHVFDKYGNWVDVASDSHQIGREESDSFTRQDRMTQGTASFKISRETTESIVYHALNLYKDKQRDPALAPENIVLHKLGPIYECEVIGFLEAIKRVKGNLDTCQLGILQVEQDHLRRLYGSPETDARLSHTVERGAGLVINDAELLLATTGRTTSNKYFGIGTPNPLLLTSVLPSPQLRSAYGCRPQQFYSIETLGQHVMALTQLHWGSTHDNVRQPITTLYAQKVADLMSKMETKIDTWTTYHRPWFL